MNRLDELTMVLGGIWIQSEGLFCWIIRMRELRMFESLQMADTTCRSTRSRSSRDSESGINLVKKKNSKSIVWDYFGLKAEDDGSVLKDNEARPVCRTCYKQIMCKGGNTSNLFSHLRDKHPALYKEANQGKTMG